MAIINRIQAFTCSGNFLFGGNRHLFYYTHMTPNGGHLNTYSIDDVLHFPIDVGFNATDFNHVSAVILENFPDVTITFKTKIFYVFYTTLDNTNTFLIANYEQDNEYYELENGEVYDIEENTFDDFIETIRLSF